MKYKVLQAVSILGTRREKGEVVDIDENLAQSIGSSFLTSEVEEKPQPKKKEKALEDMSKAELVKLAKAKKLSDKGTKADLLERIKLSE